MGRYLRIALRNLAQARRRTVLTGAAIAIVTLLLVLVSAISRSIETTLLDSATAVACGHVNVDGYSKLSRGLASFMIREPAEVERTVRAALPEAEIVDRLLAGVRVVSASDSTYLTAAGIDPGSDRRLRQRLVVKQGRFDDLEQPATIMLFERQAAYLGVKLGDTVTLSAKTMRGHQNAIDFTVVAIAADLGRLGNYYVFTAKSQIRQLLDLPSTATSRILIFLPDPSAFERVSELLHRTLERQGRAMMVPRDALWKQKLAAASLEPWQGQRLDIATWEHQLAGLRYYITTFDGISLTVIGLLLFVTVVGLLNTIWITIRERTREVGALRAIGMSRLGVLTMFWVEAGALSLGAAAVGGGLGAGVALAINAARVPLSPMFRELLWRDTLRLTVTPSGVLAAVALITAITILFALIPAYRAARLRPVVAMHHAG